MSFFDIFFAEYDKIPMLCKKQADASSEDIKGEQKNGYCKEDCRRVSGKKLTG